MTRKRFTREKAVKWTGTFFYKLLLYIVVFGLAFMILYPYLVKIITSIMSIDDFVDPTVSFIPRRPTLSTWQRSIREFNVPLAYMNSLMLSGSAALLQTVVCSLAGYGFARFKFPGNRLLFILTIFTMLVPFSTVMLPYFMNFRYFNLIFTQVNLIDSMWPILILSLFGLGIKNGLYIYFMRQFFRGLPAELEEAAFIDGSGYFRTFFRVMVPNALPSMFSVFLFSFCWSWTDTTYTSVLFNTRHDVVRAALNVLAHMPWMVDAAIISNMRNISTMLVIFPIILLYIFAQRSFIQGIERSGITS